MLQQHKRKTSLISQMRLLSLVGLSISLFILGLIGLIRIGTNGIQSKLSEQFRATVAVPRLFNKTQRYELSMLLKTRPEIGSMRYITREEAAQEIAQGLGQSVEEMLAPIGENPFDDVYELHIAQDYVAEHSLRNLEEILNQKGLEVSLNYKIDLLSSLASSTKTAEWISLGLLIILSVLTYIQVANTMRMLIYSDRINIRILTLMGASSWFIRLPMLGRAVLDGVISAFIAIGALLSVIFFLESGLNIPIRSMLEAKCLMIGACGLVLIAIMSTGISALHSALRYIRMRSGLIQLY